MSRQDDFSAQLCRNFILTSLGYLLVLLILGSSVGYAQGTATVLLITFLTTLIFGGGGSGDSTSTKDKEQLTEGEEADIVTVKEVNTSKGVSENG